MITIISLLQLFSCYNDYPITYVSENIVEFDVLDSELIVDQGEFKGDQIDILLLVDLSGSMDDNYEINSYNLSTTLEKIEDVSRDWNLGITSTTPDVGLYGQAGSDDYSLISYTLVDLWKMLEYYDAYDTDEMGMDSLMSLKDDPFHREDADLLSIVFSDEDDSSTISNSSFMNSYDNYRSHPYKEDLWSFVFYSDDEDSCGRYEAVGERYLEVSNYISHICDYITWDSKMDEFIENFSTYNTSWPLSHVPLEKDNVFVYVDGDELFSNYWDYDDHDNEIDFLIQPEKGSELLIAYTAKME